MNVKILNPEVLENLYRNHGEFACTCYATPEKYAEKVGKSCEESGHMSGSRCEYIKFQISGIDRGTAEQCLRHEIGTSVPIDQQDNYSFSDFADLSIDVSPDQIVKNMASFRYIDKTGFLFATPATIAACTEANDLYEKTMAMLNENRTKIKETLEANGVDAKRATQDANFVLPRATTTDLTIGFTPEALIHFCQKRLCVRAQEFIRSLAQMMKKEVSKYNPSFASELVPQCQHLLWCPEGKHTCGAYPTRCELKTYLTQSRGKNDARQLI
nr:MAG TPA: Thymidylate synthase complementing protein [Caudoviricetes sp.]